MASPASQNGPEVYVLPLTEVSLPVSKQPGRPSKKPQTLLLSSLPPNPDSFAFTARLPNRGRSRSDIQPAKKKNLASGFTPSGLHKMPPCMSH